MEWLQANWVVIAMLVVAVLELVLRIIPTGKNWSIIDNVKRVIEALIPNNAYTDEYNSKSVYKTTKVVNGKEVKS